MTVDRSSTGRLRRLTEELAEEGFTIEVTDPVGSVLLAELDYALRPAVHERRVPSYGAIVEPAADPAGWDAATDLTVTHRHLEGFPVRDARRFADGLSSWLVRRGDRDLELAVFDRPAGSERDLVVMAEVMDATIVQRHPSGLVRIVGAFGVLRWDGLSWHREPPVSAWIDAMTACRHHGDRDVRCVDRVGLTLGADRIVGAPQLDGPRRTGGRDLGEPELDVPRAGLDDAGDERPLRGVGLDPGPASAGRIGALVQATLPTATPPAESVGRPVAVRIPQAEVERGAVAGCPRVPHLDPRRALGDLERVHAIGLREIGCDRARHRHDTGARRALHRIGARRGGRLRSGTGGADREDGQEHRTRRDGVCEPHECSERPRISPLRRTVTGPSSLTTMSVAFGSSKE